MSAQLCESCGERPATIQYIEVVGGEKRARSMCEGCVAKEPLIDPGVIQKAASHLVEQVLQSVKPTESETAATERPDPCPGCDQSWSDFKDQSRLGCPACYLHFEREVLTVLERLHGASKHSGRAPGRAIARAERREKQSQIRSELDAAVRDEDYERAARLRDALRLLGPEESRGGTV